MRHDRHCTAVPTNILRSVSTIKTTMTKFHFRDFSSGEIGKSFIQRGKLLELLFSPLRQQTLIFKTDALFVELHFSDKLFFLMLQFVPYLSKVLETNRIKKVRDTPPPPPFTYTGIFPEGKHGEFSESS